MVEKQYGWLKKSEFVPLQRYTAQIIQFLGDKEGALKLLIKVSETSQVGEVDLWKENRNKIIDVLGNDERHWEGKHFAFSIEHKKNKEGKEQNIFHVLLK